MPKSKAVVKMLRDRALPFMKQESPHTQNSGLGRRLAELQPQGCRTRRVSRPDPRGESKSHPDSDARPTSEQSSSWSSGRPADVPGPDLRTSWLCILTEQQG